MAQSRVQKSKGKKSKFPMWGIGIIVVLVVAIAGYAIVRFSEAGTDLAEYSYKTVNGGLEGGTRVRDKQANGGKVLEVGNKVVTATYTSFDLTDAKEACVKIFVGTPNPNSGNYGQAKWYIEYGNDTSDSRVITSPKNKLGEQYDSCLPVTSEMRKGLKIVIAEKTGYVAVYNTHLNKAVSDSAEITSLAKSAYKYWLSPGTTTDPKTYQNMKKSEYISDSVVTASKNKPYDLLTCSQNATAYSRLTFGVPSILTTTTATIGVNAKYDMANSKNILLGLTKANGDWKITSVVCP